MLTGGPTSSVWSGRSGAVAVSRFVLAGAVVAAIVLALAVTTRSAFAASAHAELVSSVPAAGEQVAMAPAELLLHFSEAVDLADSRVSVAVDGQAMATGPLRSDGGSTVGVALASSRPAGRYTVEWRSVSADDGHAASGRVEFTAAGGPPPEPTTSTSAVASVVATSAGGASSPPSSATSRRLVNDLFPVDRTLGYLGIAVLCGGWIFLILVWPAGASLARTRLLLAVGWGVGFVSSLLGLGLQGAVAGQRGLSAVIDSTSLGNALDSHAGRAWAARCLLFLLALPLLAALTRGERVVRARWWRVGAAIVAGGLVRAPGLAGHSIEGLHGIAGSAADFVHVAGMAAWVGGLVLMAVVVLPATGPDELASILPRFSTVAAVSVSLIVVAGAVLAWDIAGGLHGLTNTHYGRVLGLKVLILAAALLAARSSKRWTDSRLRLAVALRGDRVTVRPFAISVASEALLAVALLGVASVLVSSSPGR